MIENENQYHSAKMKLANFTAGLGAYTRINKVPNIINRAFIDSQNLIIHRLTAEIKDYENRGADGSI